MSWSVKACGAPAQVKSAIAKQFDEILPSLKEIDGLKHEHLSAKLTSEIIAAQLDFLIHLRIPGGVRVSASGTAWFAGNPPVNGSTAMNLSIEMIPDFVG